MTQRKGERMHSQQHEGGPPEAATEPAATEASAPPEESIDALRAQLEEEKAKAQSYQANWQRAVADFQNFKRRNEEERANYQRLANLSFVLNILPVVDDLERALGSLDVKLA